MILDIPGGLTAQDIEDRRHFVGGSDANRIMLGTPRDVADLLFFKRGGPASNLDDVLIVQLGIVTEDLNRKWFTRKTGRSVYGENIRVPHPANGWQAATPDGLTTASTGDDAVLEAKYSSGRISLPDLVEKYFPQVQHNMYVLNMSWTVLSVIFGDGNYAFAEIEFDPEYCDRLVERERIFWNCRLTGEPWPDLPDPPNPDIERILKMSKPLDMSRHNEWCSLAPDWLRLHQATDEFKKVDAKLKALVNPEVRRCYGAGIVGTVSKNGAKTLKPDPDYVPANNARIAK